MYIINEIDRDELAFYGVWIERGGYALMAGFTMIHELTIQNSKFNKELSTSDLKAALLHLIN
jgi:hypothetical protein